MNDSDLILHETARMDIYKGLSACYYLPEARLRSQLEKMVRQLAFLDSDASALAVLMRGELRNAVNLEPLQVEFARLFIGPYQMLAPPYGSIYLEGEHKIMGDSTVDVGRRYSDSGLAITETFKDAPDHIAAEMEYMYFLVFNEIAAFHSARADEGCEYLIRQQSFLSEHLGAWTGDFSARTEKAAECDFFRHLAGVTKAFIAEDLQYLESLNVCPAC